MRLVYLLLASLFLSNFVIAQCDDFTVDLSFTNPLCPDYSDGSVTAVPSGGTAPYTILITDAAGEVRNADGGSETGFLLLEGWYYVDIEDAIGCVFSDSVLLVDPLEINVESYSLSDPSEVGVCDGSITLNEVTGDYATVFVSWSPDPDGISGIDAFEMEDACAGVYEVTLLSELGCAISAEYEIGGGLNIAENTKMDMEVYKTLNGVKVVCTNDLKFIAYSLDGKSIINQQLNSGENYVQTNYDGFLIYLIVDPTGKILHHDKTIK